MPLSIEAFCEQLAEMGLLSRDDVRAVVESLPPERRPKDTQSLIRELVREHRLTSYQAQQVYQGHGKGLFLGNYVVLDKIGQGGMGMVLKAQHKRMRRVVALKVICPRSTESTATARRFHREVEAAAKLIHPNIVTAFDADESDGTSFLVMEYVDGTDLSTLVRLDGPLPIDTAIHCVVQAARGLEYAHTKGVIHRDIKPRNLLLNRDGAVKILDMGLARVETSAGQQQTDLTGAGQIMGTIDYMAPEQAVSPKQADERADIYSLGITLWYLLTGRPTYEGETVLEKLVAHREQPVPSLADACPGVTPELDAVFRRMVAKKPQHRYPSMTELIADLDRCRLDPDGCPTVQMDAGEGRRLQEFLKGIDMAAERRTAAAVAARTFTLPSGETVIDGQAACDTDPEVQRSLPLALQLTAAPAVRTAARRKAPPIRPRKLNPTLVVTVVTIVALAAALALLYVFRHQLERDSDLDTSGLFGPVPADCRPAGRQAAAASPAHSSSTTSWPDFRLAGECRV